MEDDELNAALSVNANQQERVIVDEQYRDDYAFKSEF
jgi:hypothetical protein